jgi:DNA-binding transcriptional LysR family regulator
MAEFMELYPKVEANCTPMPWATAVQKLSEGEVHVALACEREAFQDLYFKQFVTDQIVLIAPLNHAWARCEWIEPEELPEARFIWREEGSGTRTVAVQALQQVGISLNQLNNVLTLGSSEGIALAVQEGIGVGFVSQIVVSRLVSQQVALVRVRGLEINRHIYVGRSSSRIGTAAQNAFWSFVTDAHNPVLRRLHFSEAGRRDGYRFAAVSATIGSV